MNFRQFLWTWLKNAFRLSWEIGHIVHQICVFLVGFLLLVTGIFGVLSSKLEEPKILIAAPLVGAVLVFLGSLVWYAYNLYREEYDRRAARESLLESERASVIRNKLISLPNAMREALKQLCMERRMGAEEIRKRFPNVDFVVLSGLTGVLQHDQWPVDVWSIREDSQDFLHDFFLGPAIQPAVKKSLGGLARAYRRFLYLVRKWKDP